MAALFGATEDTGMARRWDAVDLVLSLGPALLFLTFKAFALNPAVSDENIYFYDAWLMAKGHVPYRDFFFAHPPLHLVPGWALVFALGYNFSLLKLLPGLAALGTGFAVYGLARGASGRLAGVVSVLAFYLSHDLLRASSHWTGINWSVAAMTAGLFLALRRQPLASGLVYGVAVCTGVYTTAAALVTGAILTWLDRSQGRKFWMAAIGVWAAINLGFSIWVGALYWEQVYQYHWLKPERSGLEWTRQVWPLLFHNFHILIGPWFLVVAQEIKRHWNREWNRAEPSQTGDRARIARIARWFDPGHDTERAVAWWCVVHAAAGWCFLMMLGRVYHFYFLLLFPVGAVGFGMGAARLVFLWRDAAVRKSITAELGVLSLLVVGGWWMYPQFERQLGYYPREYGETRTYRFPISTLPEFAVAGIKAFWWDPERTVGQRYSGALYYLWHESRTFDEAYDIAAWLKIRSSPGETLFGDSTTAPLVARLAGLELVDNIVDTNAMRFRSGITSASEMIQTLKRQISAPTRRLTWVLLRPRRGVHGIAEFQAFLRGHFRMVRVFDTQNHGPIWLMIRGQGAEVPHG